MLEIQLEILLCWLLALVVLTGIGIAAMLTIFNGDSKDQPGALFVFRVCTVAGTLLFFGGLQGMKVQPPPVCPPCPRVEAAVCKP